MAKDDKDIADRAVTAKVSHILREDPLKLREAQKRIGEGKLRREDVVDTLDEVAKAIKSFGMTVEGQEDQRVEVTKGQTVHLHYKTATVSTTTVDTKDGKPALHESVLVIKGSPANGTSDKTFLVVKETQIGDRNDKGQGSIGTLIEKTVYDTKGNPTYRSTSNISHDPEYTVASTEVKLEKEGITVKRWANRDVDSKYKPRTGDEKIGNEEMKKEYEAKLKKLIEKEPQDKSTNPIVPNKQQDNQLNR